MKEVRPDLDINFLLCYLEVEGTDLKFYDIGIWVFELSIIGRDSYYLGSSK